MGDARTTGGSDATDEDRSEPIVVERTAPSSPTPSGSFASNRPTNHDQSQGSVQIRGSSLSRETAVKWD